MRRGWGWGVRDCEEGVGVGGERLSLDTGDHGREGKGGMCVFCVRESGGGGGRGTEKACVWRRGRGRDPVLREERERDRERGGGRRGEREPNRERGGERESETNRERGDRDSVERGREKER